MMQVGTSKTSAASVFSSVPWAAAWPAGQPHRLDLPRSTLCDSLAAAADRHPDKAALDDGRLRHAVVHCYADALRTDEAEGLDTDLSVPDAVAAPRLPLDHPHTAGWAEALSARLIERSRVSAWAAPPVMLNDFFAHPEAQRRDLSSLAILNGGGAAMPEALSGMLKARFGLDYIEGYGLTETASFLHCNPLGRGKRQCLGIPAFGVDSRIVDPETLAECLAARPASW